MMTKPTTEIELHKAIPAAERDKTSPVWDMSQERVFIEQLLNQRFNFFLVVFSLVIAGAINSKQQIHLQIILTIGLTLELSLASLLGRSQEKLDLIIHDLCSDPSHPVTIINSRAEPKGSRRRLVGIWIPRACCAVLFVATVLAWFDIFTTAKNAA